MAPAPMRWTWQAASCPWVAAEPAPRCQSRGAAADWHAALSAPLCDLLFLPESANLTQTHSDHGMALRRFADAMVGALPGPGARRPRRDIDERLLLDNVAADAQSGYRLLSELERHDRHRLDISHLTDQTGSPQTQVFHKTRASFQRLCRQYAEAVGAMCALQVMGHGALLAECAQVDAAAARQPQVTQG